MGERLVQPELVAHLEPFRMTPEKWWESNGETHDWIGPIRNQLDVRFLPRTAIFSMGWI